MNLSGVNVGQIQSQQTVKQAVIQEGQVLHGTIQKLYPDQQAEISIGGQKMIAKLETSMQAGNSHFFQVTSTQPELTLKMVSGPIDPKASSLDQMKQMMESMKLPQTKELQQVVLQLVKNDIPFNKEQILSAESLLKGVKGSERTQTIDALQKMIELKLPMTRDSLQAVIQGSAKIGFTNLLGNLEQLIKSDATLSPSLQQQVLDRLTQLKAPLSEQTGSMLLGKMLQGATGNKQDIQSLLTQVGILSKSTQSNQTASVTEQLFNQLKSDPSDIIKTLMSTQDLTAKRPLQALSQLVGAHPTLTKDQQQSIQQAITRVQLAPTEANQSQLVKEVTAQLQDAKQSITQLLSQLKTATAEQTPQTIQKIATAIASTNELTLAQKQQVIQQLGQVPQTGAKTAFEAVLRVFSEQVGQLPSEALKTQMAQLLGVSQQNQNQTFQQLAKTAATFPSLQQAVQSTESQQAAQITGQAVHMAMKQTLSELGLSLEARMLQPSQDHIQLSATLKSLMHAVLNDQAAPATKAAAEQIVARMNGQQLLSVENGTQQQLVMQVPLQFFGKRTDATLQWSGNKNKDGKIDSNFARVMFYLQLDSLDETVIDMQVQSRVVTLNIYTDQNTENTLVEPLKNALKTNLEQKDYHLSGVFLKNFTRSTATVKQQTKTPEQRQERGVDFRI